MKLPRYITALALEVPAEVYDFVVKAYEQDIAERIDDALTLIRDARATLGPLVVGYGPECDVLRRLDDALAGTDG